MPFLGLVRAAETSYTFGVVAQPCPSSQRLKALPVTVQPTTSLATERQIEHAQHALAHGQARNADGCPHARRQQPAAHLKRRPRHVSLPGSLEQYYAMKLTTALHDVARFAKIRNS